MNKILKLVSSALAIGIAGVALAVDTNDATVGSTAVSAGLRTPMIIVGYADFAKTAAGAGDVYKVITIPAGYIVQAVSAKTVTKESATSAVTFTIGDSAGVSQYIAGGSLSNTTLNVSAISSNKLYSTADFISVIPSATATVGKVKVQACVIPFE